MERMSRRLANDDACRIAGLRVPTGLRGGRGSTVARFRVARHFFSALPALPLSLSIALSGVCGSDAIAGGCSGWEDDDSMAFRATATETGAEPNARLRNRFELEQGRGIGETPLHRAVRCDAAVSVTKVSLDAGADSRAIDEHGATPPKLSGYGSRDVGVLLDARVREHPLENSNVLPAGTRVSIPHWVMEDCPLRTWGAAFNCQYLKCAVTKPSRLKNGEYTAYLPMAWWNGSGEQTVMVDMMAIQMIDTVSKTEFVTTREIEVLEIPPAIETCTDTNQLNEEARPQTWGE